jgi:magnesium-transporting ATPase (P-type)
VIPKRLFFALLVFAIGAIALQLASGVWLFVAKYGLSPSEVYLYFSGNEADFIMPKSFEGLMETAVPHFLAISTTIFVFAHFLLFTQVISEKKKELLITSLFLTAILDILSPFGMIHGYEIFAWVKLIAFWSFEMLMGLLMFVLFQALFDRGAQA